MTLSLDTAFRENARFVANTLRRFGVGTADLADQTQEVFMIVHNLRDDFDDTRPLRPWLFGITYRVAARYRQRKGRDIVTTELVGDVADPALPVDRKLEGDDARDLVLNALEHVDLPRRAILIMADIDGHAIPEIAESLRIPLNTAYSRLRVARDEFTRAVRRLSLSKEYPR